MVRNKVQREKIKNYEEKDYNISFKKRELNQVLDLELSFLYI